MKNLIDSANLNQSPEKYQVCNRCVMDTSAQDIRFDSNGICNYCQDFEHLLTTLPLSNPYQRQFELEKLVEKVRRDGKGKPYDCIVGLSGGVDSAYTLLKVKELGLRPLAVHMDNGWDSELAANNIQTIIQGLGVDLYTHVIDWEEYRDLMQAFFDADVIDVELLYDNAMQAVNYNLACKYDLHYILAGSNHATEGMAMPPGWNWFKHDVRNIWAIQKRFGTKKSIRTFPTLSFSRYVWLRKGRGISWISFLDYVEYDKPKALAFLAEQYGFRPYPYKHYESIFTRFYQGYILPKKFAVDKRRLHFSTLIISGQMKREEAIKDLQNIPYPDQQILQRDIEYFLKKMNWNASGLNDYIQRPGESHLSYSSEEPLYRCAWKIWKFFKPITSALK
ncbi:N-acetyl sugar amidotransferase [Laspinema olomoucense]|uniref:N-acetyl sugar amidotransferase n=1 Tax=Laspinema olomoucense TaxID=3231600 RepID=UPI0021BAE470|nr:N-acetyl sugar amidotransferase [Laspinema sp. D3c]MCT7995235.1 N-acetyl sugar amidotransferase [Laspinema sp. D3c]